MVSTLVNEKWTEVYNECSDANRCYIIFNKIIKSTTCMLVNIKHKRLKEWMTNELLTSARRK